MNDAPIKPKVLTLLHFARQQELIMMERLSDVERDERGTQEKWAAKDYLVGNAI